MKFKFNLESKIAILVVILIVSVYLITACIDYEKGYADIQKQSKNEAAKVVETLRISIGSAVSVADPASANIIKDMVDELGAANRNITKIVVTRRVDGEPLGRYEKAYDGPIDSASATFGTGENQATIMIEFRTTSLHDYLITNLKEKSVTALFILGFAILITALLIRKVTKSLTLLTDAVQSVAAGDLTQKVTIRSKDEIGALGTAFNQMTDNLEQSHSQLNAANAALDKRIRELTTLYEINALINSSSIVKEILSLTTEMITTGFGVEICSVLLKKEDTGSLVMFSGRGLEDTSRQTHTLPTETGIASTLLTRGEAMFIDDLDNHPELVNGFTPEDRAKVAYVFAIPLKAGERILGLLTIYRLASGKTPNDADQNLFSIIASLIAPSIQMALLHEERAASIANPFAPLQERIDRELDRVRKFKIPFSIVRVTVDNFSAYCKQHGYTAGNLIFAELEKALMDIVPNAESVIRFSLNAVAVIQAGKAGPEAAAAVRDCCAAARAAAPGLAAFKISGRVAAFPDDGDEALALIDKLTRP